MTREHDIEALAQRLTASEDACRRLEAELQRLAARAAITDTIYRFSRGVDRLDHSLMLSAFHPGARVSFGAMFSGDAKAFVDFTLQVQNPAHAVQHMVGNVLIDRLGDDEAAVESYEVSRHPARAADGDMVLASRLVDRFTRRDGQWRIAQRTKIGDWARILPGSDPLYGSLKIDKARRDTSDLSYALLQASG